MFKTKQETKELVDAVVNSVYDTVVSTMGPNGNFVAIQNGPNTSVTKDGVTVARSIQFQDEVKERINRIITEPAVKTDQECGDGTTTTIFLTKHLYELLSKYNSFVEREYIKKYFERVICNLEEASINVDVHDERFLQLAITSANHEVEIANKVVDIYKESGNVFPEIELQEGSTLEDKVVDSNGLIIRAKFSDPIYSQYGNNSATTFNKPFKVLIIDENLKEATEKDLANLIRQLKTEGDVFLIARNVEHSFNSSIVKLTETLRQSGDYSNRIRVLATNTGGSLGSLVMGDIASIFGVPVYRSIENLPETPLPVVEGVELVVDGRRTIMTKYTDEVKERITERVEAIKTELTGYAGGARQSPLAKFNETRMRNLSSTLVTVFVGGSTVSDVKERLDRFEDVVRACKSALIGGVLPGQGNALINAIPEEEEGEGNELTDDCRSVLLLQKHYLIEGSYNDEEEHKSILFDTDKIFNLITGKIQTVEESGIYDTALASIVALKGGLSTALILSNLSSVIMGNKFASVIVR